MLIMSVVIRNIKTQLLMNVYSLNVRLYSCKSPLLTIGSNGVSNSFDVPIRKYGITLYVGLACAVSPTNTNFRLTFLLTRLQEALYEDLAV